MWKKKKVFYLFAFCEQEWWQPSDGLVACPGCTLLIALWQLEQPSGLWLLYTGKKVKKIDARVFQIAM